MKRLIYEIRNNPEFVDRQVLANNVDPDILEYKFSFDMHIFKPQKDCAKDGWQTSWFALTSRLFSTVYLDFTFVRYCMLYVLIYCIQRYVCIKLTTVTSNITNPNWDLGNGTLVNSAEPDQIPQNVASD